MELSLRDSELRYRRLFEAAQDGILILDAKTGMIEDVNAYLIKMLGYSREEFVKKKLWEVGAFKDIEASKDAFEVLQESEYIRYEDLPLKTKDGRLVQVEFVSNVYLAGDKKVIQCNIRDITEHKRIITALLANEMKYHDLLNQSSDGIFIIDLTGNVLTVNRAMCRELEFSEEEFLSMKIWEVIPEQYVNEYRERLTKILDGEIFEKPGEYEVRGKDGRNHYVEILSTPHYYEQDIVGFQGIAHDITARKRAEEAVRASEELMRYIVRHDPNAIAVFDQNLHYIAVSDRYLQDYEVNEQDIIGKHHYAVFPEMPEKWKDVHRRCLEGAIERNDNDSFERPDGSITYNRWECRPWHKENGDIGGIVTYTEVTTERKLAEEALRESEAKFRRLVEHLPTVIYTNAVGNASSTLYVSPQIETLMGYTPQEWLDDPKLWSKTLHPEDRQRVLERAAHTDQSNEPFDMEYRMIARDGRLVWVHDEIILVKDLNGKPQSWQGIMLDITERKQTEEQTRFQANLLNAVGQAIIATDAAGIVTYINRAAENLYGWLAEETRGRTILDVTVPQASEIQAEEIMAHLSRGESWSGEFLVQHRDGRVFPVDVYDSPILNNENELIGIIGLSSDITERKQAEEALQASEAKFRSYNEYAPLAVFIVDQSGRYVEVNAAATKMLGHTESELLQLSIPDVLAPQSLEAGLQHFQKVVQDGSAAQEFLFRRKDGTQFWATVLAVRLGEDRFMSYCQDITGRKQAEEILREKEHLLSEAQSIGHMGSLSYDITADAFQLSDEMYRLLDVSPQEFQHNKEGFLSLIYASDRPMVTKWMEDIRAGSQVKELDFRLIHKNGELCHLHSRGAVLFDPDGNPARFTGTAQDISERKLAEIQIRQQIQRLTSLGKIDQAIISTSNLDAMMEIFLAQVVAQLQVDAADILLLHPNSETLEYFAGRGFRTQAAKGTEVPIDKRLAGRVARERRLIRIEDLQDQSRDHSLSERLAGEGFVSYFGVPLITKGKVKGVLEVFQRTAMYPYADWLDFLNTLASQAAIAIENASLFANLEKSNQELSQAYDATIVGWSHALDLRDKETEGHTLRVTELTLTLARKFNFTDTQMLYIRWGALLHDIGKMGIPDHILLKPDVLSEEEGAIMRKHPQYAYDLLQPIRFLTPALDIPYCHHEKWDGTGYPQGLKGEEIPLQARIFAVVDTWDALCSDRPYRPRWPEDKVCDHIRTLSGTHFDPQVVDIFMQVSQSK